MPAHREEDLAVEALVRAVTSVYLPSSAITVRMLTFPLRLLTVEDKMYQYLLSYH